MTKRTIFFILLGVIVRDMMNYTKYFWTVLLHAADGNFNSQVCSFRIQYKWNTSKLLEICKHRK